MYLSVNILYADPIVSDSFSTLWMIMMALVSAATKPAAECPYSVMAPLTDTPKSIFQFSFT